VIDRPWWDASRWIGLLLTVLVVVLLIRILA
jgi:hypothetical protein